ncbi:MAG: lipid-A-disaccharide synthase [Hyphomicrobiaceae bacterium]
MSSRNNSLISRLRNDTTEKPPQPHTEAVEERLTVRHDLRATSQDEITVFIVAGEHSGDALGGGLMRELASRRKGQMRFIGVGGEAMEAQGLTSLFPLADIAVMGPLAILSALPRLTNRVYRTVSAGVTAKPDVIVIIDSPEFTHRVAKRLSRQLPDTPIINYVCPSVWAWRPGRAKTMARFIDHVLALLPFEPDALERLQGPPATYIGHPLSERQNAIKTIDTDVWAARLGLDRHRIPLVVLPGSRRSEVEKLMPVFTETIEELDRAGHSCEILLPCVPHLRDRIDELSKNWPMRRHLIDGDEAKFAAFRLARAALAASGTVTLELGIAGTPMVVAYRVDGLAAKLRFLVKVDSVVLANLVLEEKAFPEFLQEDCNAEQLSTALIKLIEDGSARKAQLRALERLSEKMRPLKESPSQRAADVIMQYTVAGHIQRSG